VSTAALETSPPATPPVEPFVDALVAFGERYPG